VPDEAELKHTDAGLIPGGEGWFVVNARESGWMGADGWGRFTDFEGAQSWPSFGFGIHVLDPGERMGLYHREELHEAFLLLSGEATLVVEGEERALRPWDFFNCPPWTEHILVGAGDAPAVFICASNRIADRKIVYPVSEVAARHDASVPEETDDPRVAYPSVGAQPPQPYRDGDLP